MKKGSKQNRITSDLREKIKVEYLSGIAISKIIEKYHISKEQFEKLRTRYKWKRISKEIEKRTEEIVIEKIAQSKAKVLAQMNDDSLVIIKNCMIRLQDESEYDDIGIFNAEGDQVCSKKVYSEINALIRGWSLAYSRLLRSIGEPDSIKDKPELDNGKTNPIFHILMDTGLKPEFKEKIINSGMNKH